MTAIKNYLDSTYLKTHEQAAISEIENRAIALSFIEEAIHFDFKLIMIRPEYVSLSRKTIDMARSKVLVGTVIDFPLGLAAIENKLEEAQKAIAAGADEIDFVINYQAFKKGLISLVKNEVLQGTKFCLKHQKTVKWIIETAALTEKEIVQITVLIKNTIIANFTENDYPRIFVKSSTGFYKTVDGIPNGATSESIIMMLENAAPLPVKASGGIRNYDDAIGMIKLGVLRIGTSAAKAIVTHRTDSMSDY
jgi:deoxyribose-phosphate aldolase